MRDGGKIGRFGDVQVRGVFAEESTTCFLNAVVVATIRNAVEIEIENVSGDVAILALTFANAAA